MGLLRILVALGQDITIAIADAPAGRAPGLVNVLPAPPGTPAPVKAFPARPARRRKQG